MVKLGTKISEKTIFLVLFVFLLFTLLIFDMEMSVIFLLMLTADYVWYKEDPNITLPTEKSSDGRLISIFWAVIIYAGFLGLTSGLMSLFSTFGAQGIGGGVASVLQLLASTTPVLAGSKVLTLIGWGIIIPIIETRFFFGRLLEGLSAALEMFLGVKIPTTFNIKNIWLHLVVFIIAAIFALFHLTAKGLTNNLGLFIVFLFAFISCWLVLWFRQLREAILFHILSNSVSVIARIGPELLNLVGITIGGK